MSEQTSAVDDRGGAVPAAPLAGEACYVVVGGGQAGAVAVATLREAGFGGRIVLVGAEPHLPYERPPLSKEVLVAPESAKTLLFDSAFYAGQGIECRFGVAATRLDAAARTLELASGERLAFTKLLLATGARARPYPLLDDLGDGVFSLRSLDDAQALRQRLQPGCRLLVIGGGVIGLEVAASARTLGAEVAVIERGTRLMGRAAPRHLADNLHQLHVAQGVRFAFGAELVAAERSAVGEIVLTSRDGRGFSGDLVVYGIGVELNDGLAREAGLKADDGILVDEFGQTSAPGIYAAGDVARQWNPVVGRHVRQETWSNAQTQAAGVARAMVLGTPCVPDLPWYWTDQYGHNIQVAGAVEAEAWLTRGEAGRRYTQFGISDGRIVGAITFDNGREMRPAKQLISEAAAISEPALLLDSQRDLRKLAIAYAGRG